MLLTKELLTQQRPRETKDVPLPEFNGELRIRKWNGHDRDEYDEWAATRPKSRDGDIRAIRAAQIAVSAVDEEGNRLFNMNGDVAKICEWPWSAIDRVFEVVNEWNGLGAKAVEDAEKNSSTTGNSGGGTSSAPGSESPSEN